MQHEDYPDSLALLLVEASVVPAKPEPGHAANSRRACSRPSAPWLHAVRPFGIRKWSRRDSSERPGESSKDPRRPRSAEASLAGSGPPFDPLGCTRSAPNGSQKGVAGLIRATNIICVADKLGCLICLAQLSTSGMAGSTGAEP